MERESVSAEQYASLVDAYKKQKLENSVLKKGLLERVRL